MPVLLDTSALLAHFRDEIGADRAQRLLEDERESILICSVSLPEFARGLRELGVNQTECNRILADYKQLADQIVAVDEAVAETSDELLRSTPSRLPLVDALIAAAARHRGATLVHRDGHFRAIPRSLMRQLDLADGETQRAPSEDLMPDIP